MLLHKKYNCTSQALNRPKKARQNTKNINPVQDKDATKSKQKLKDESVPNQFYVAI